jgi:hypothetical protein
VWQRLEAPATSAPAGGRGAMLRPILEDQEFVKQVLGK